MFAPFDNPFPDSFNTQPDDNRIRQHIENPTVQTDLVSWSNVTGRFTTLPFGWVCEHEGRINRFGWETYTLHDQANRFSWSIKMNQDNDPCFQAWLNMGTTVCRYELRCGLSKWKRCYRTLWHVTTILDDVSNEHVFYRDARDEMAMCSLGLRFTVRPLYVRNNEYQLKSGPIQKVHGLIHEGMVLSVVASGFIRRMVRLRPSE